MKLNPKTLKRIPMQNYVGPDLAEWTAVMAEADITLKVAARHQDGHMHFMQIHDKIGFKLPSFGQAGSHNPRVNRVAGGENMTKYQVVLHPEETGGFTVECPAIPGCFSEGETEDEALQNIREAIEGCLAVRNELGLPVDVVVRSVEV